jgi:hypothetical protein
MHLKVFVKLKKTLKTLSSGQKNPKNPKKPKKPNKTQKTQKNPTGLGFFYKNPDFFQPWLADRYDNPMPQSTMSPQSGSKN